jgi:hypothetical protein
MGVAIRRRFANVRAELLIMTLCGVFVSTFGATARAQTPREWTEIDARGTAVDWTSLEQQPAQRGEQTIALIWARTVEHDDTIAVHVAVRCAPAHAAVVAVERPRRGGGVDLTGPVSLSALAWQDPPPLSYLRQVMRAVCTRARGERNRPC